MIAYSPIRTCLAKTSLVVATAWFLGGWSKAPVVQSFLTGTWNSGGCQLFFDTVDGKGRLQIRKKDDLRTTDIPVPPPAILTWRGNQFR